MRLKLVSFVTYSHATDPYSHFLKMWALRPARLETGITMILTAEC
jgi:hypothetical protein